MTTTDLYPYLIIIGSSILAAAGWLLHQFRKQQQLTRELTQLNEQLGYDLPDFLAHCWPLLRRSGFTGMRWQLGWFGTHTSAEQGRIGGPSLRQLVKVQEISLEIHLYRDKSQWEQRYFSDAQAENFLLLVRMNMWIKVGTVQGTFEQTAKMTVFLKHDVKNMVQLLTLTAEQLQHTPPTQEAALLRDLRGTMPALRERAEHMLRTLGDPAQRRRQADLPPPPLALEELLQQAASLYDLPLQINGSAQVALDRDLLLSIVDNLLGNYSQQLRGNPGKALQLELNITVAEAMATLSIRDLHGTPFLWPERLFEPFWSEHGAGRGVGLYQARQLAQMLGGDLNAVAAPDQPLHFLLTLPAAVLARPPPPSLEL